MRQAAAAGRDRLPGHVLEVHHHVLGIQPALREARLPSLADTPRGYATLGDITFKPRGSEQPVAFEFKVGQ